MAVKLSQADVQQQEQIDALEEQVAELQESLKKAREAFQKLQTKQQPTRQVSKRTQRRTTRPQPEYVSRPYSEPRDCNVPAYRGQHTHDSSGDQRQCWMDYRTEMNQRQEPVPEETPEPADA